MRTAQSRCDASSHGCGGDALVAWLEFGAPVDGGASSDGGVAVPMWRRGVAATPAPAELQCSGWNGKRMT
jgi:hypothetical protein